MKAAHAIAITLPLALAIVTLSVIGPLVIMLAGEAFVLTVLPRLAVFQRYVDERRAREARISAAIQRAALMARMAPERCMELERLEAIVGEVRARSGCGGEHDEWAGLEELLALYVRLAVAQNASAGACDRTPVAEIDAQIDALERSRPAIPESTRDWADRRIAVLRRRKLVKARADEKANVIACALQTIADLVRCVHDECLASQGASAARDAAAAVSRAVENSELLGELAALRDEDALDPAVLELGRQGAFELVALEPAAVDARGVLSPNGHLGAA